MPIPSPKFYRIRYIMGNCIPTLRFAYPDTRGMLSECEHAISRWRDLGPAGHEI